MNLILIHPEELDATGRARLTDTRAEHIRKVLRAEPGKELRIGLVNGPFGTGTVEVVSPEEVVLACELEAETPPRSTIDLLLAMPRPKVLKRLWAQFAALGVGRIFITNAEKVERYYFDTHILEPDFYNARFIEGLQQARDTRLPEVTIVKNLKPFLENDFLSEFGEDKQAPTQLVPMSGKKILADPSGDRSLFQCLENVDATPSSRFQPLEESAEKVPTLGTDCVGVQRFARQGQSILLGIGPEGGWTPYELEMFKAQGFDLFGMGPRILRTDTACIALLGMISEIKRRHS